MVHQVGVQRVVAGDQHDQRALAAPARAAGLLPERRHGARKAGQHHRVQTRDVDAQFQRVGGGQPAQFAVGQRAFQRAPVLGEITGPVGGHPCRRAPVRSSSSRARAPSAVSSAPRRDRTNVSVRAPSAIRSAITRAASAPAERRTGAPFSPTRSARSAGSHSATVRAPCGEPSSVTSATVCPISSAAVSPGQRGGRAGEDHRRRPPMPSTGRTAAAAGAAPSPRWSRKCLGSNGIRRRRCTAGCAGTPPSGRGCAAATDGSCRGWRRSTATAPGRIGAPRWGCRRRRRSARRRRSRGHRRGQRVRGAQLVVAERLGRRQIQRPWRADRSASAVSIGSW